MYLEILDEPRSMASINDISAMKLAAIGSRGSRKDFYDLYQFYKLSNGFGSAILLENVRKKFGDRFDPTYMIMGLNYFDVADKEQLPKLFVNAEWAGIKRFFIEEQMRLFDELKARFDEQV